MSDVTIKPEILDALLAGTDGGNDLLAEGGLLRQLKKALMERALEAELTHHLGYEKGAAPPARARQQPERPDVEDGADGGGGTRAIDPARPRRQL